VYKRSSFFLHKSLLNMHKEHMMKGKRWAFVSRHCV